MSLYPFPMTITITPRASPVWPGYDTKQSDGETPVMLEFWGMQSTLLLPSLPGLLWPERGVPDRVLFMD